MCLVKFNIVCRTAVDTYFSISSIFAQSLLARSFIQILFFYIKIVFLLDFRYIIQRQTPAPICFGTKQERECLPLRGKGLSTFMKYYTKPYYPDISPNTYDYATKTSFRSSKVREKR